MSDIEPIESPLTRRAIQALESAVDVLGTATEGNTGVSFMAKKSHMSMKKVLEVTKQGLSSSDYRFFVKARGGQLRTGTKLLLMRTKACGLACRNRVWKEL